MRYLKQIFIVIFILITCYTGYKYYLYNKILDSTTLEELSDDLTIPVLNYAGQFEKEDLTNSESLMKMFKWVENNYSVIKKHDRLLNYGYEIKYDKEKDFYLFCLYGEDKKRSINNISIKEIDAEGFFSTQIPSFFKYLIGSSDYDILLFGYKKKPLALDYGRCRISKK